MSPWSLWGKTLAACVLALSAVHAWAQPAVGTRVSNGVLVVDSKRSVPLPEQGGSWTVVYSEPDSRAQSNGHIVGLVHSDPQSPVPVMMVRHSQRSAAWRGSVCEITASSAFMLEYYGSQISGNSQRCSVVFPVRTLGTYRATATSAMWAPFFKSGVDLSAVPDVSYLLASWRMQEFGEHNLIVEAMVRADALGTSSGELMDTFRSNQLNPAHRAIKDWLMSAVTQTAATYFKGQPSRLAVLDVAQVRQVMQNATPAQRENFAAAPVIGTSLGTAVETAASADDRWQPPVDIETGAMVTMSKTWLARAGTAFELTGLEPVRAVANGRLVYQGTLPGIGSGFVLDHANGLYSVLASTMNWQLGMGPEVGALVEQGQFLASAASSRGVLTWEVWSIPASVLPQDGAALLQRLRSGEPLNTRALANIGALEFATDASKSDVALVVDGRPVPSDRAFDAVYLFKAGRLPLQVTSGGLFKTVTKDEINLSARGLTVQNIGRKGNSGLGATSASFTSADVGRTDEILARLQGATPQQAVVPVTASTPVALAQPSPAAVAPTPAGPSAAELAERARLQAEATQREQELERLRQQLAQAEAQRRAEAQRAAEAQRLADARAADAARLAEAQRVAEQQRQADAQAQAQRQQEAQRQAQAARQAEEARQQALAQQQAQQQAQQAQAARQAEQAAEAQRVAALNSGKRKALVIGNDLYRNVPKLDNARSDARAMGQSLQSLGFKVTVALDLTERGMKETLRNFKSTVQGGDEVVVFYAGHGVQLGASNYLLPVDIAGQDEAQVRDEAIQMQRILDDMQEQRTGFMLMIVDACRDNPFKVAGRSIGGRGLAPTSAATGQMVIFSAGAGQQALDRLGPTDKEPNGLFTRLFLREMQKPGQPVDRVLRSVRSEVARLARSVGHEQTPALYDQSLGDFFLKP